MTPPPPDSPNTPNTPNPPDSPDAPSLESTVAESTTDAGSQILSPEQADLARAIADAALLRGTFTLRSGRTSSYYLDKYLFSTRPEVLERVGNMFAERIRRLILKNGPIHRLAGAELGGIPLVTVASLKTGLPSVFIRNKKKDYGTAKQVEGAVNAGDRIVLIEDVATTGGQAIEAAEALTGDPARPVTIVAVIATIDRLEGARANIESRGILFDSLFTKRDLGITE